MYVCMYVGVCICMYVCMCVRMYICMFVCGIYVRNGDCDESVHACGDVFAKVLHQRYVILTVQKKLQSDGVVWTPHVLVLFHVQHQLQAMLDSFTTPNVYSF